MYIQGVPKKTQHLLTLSISKELVIVPFVHLYGVVGKIYFYTIVEKFRQNTLMVTVLLHFYQRYLKITLRRFWCFGNLRQCNHGLIIFNKPIIKPLTHCWRDTNTFVCTLSWRDTNTFVFTQVSMMLQENVCNTSSTYANGNKLFRVRMRNGN